MGDAKRRRDAKGVTDERTTREHEQALKDELWRIRRHKNGQALEDRRYGVIPHKCRPGRTSSSGK